MADEAINCKLPFALEFIGALLLCLRKYVCTQGKTVVSIDKNKAIFFEWLDLIVPILMHM